MGYLFDAGFGITLNLVSSLVWDKKLVIEERKKIKTINTKISDFNRKYDNTILDTYVFQQFINSEKFMEEIYDRIFKSYIKEELNIDQFKSKISNDAILYVNEKYKTQGRNSIKDTEIFYGYFCELTDILIDTRNDLLSLDQSTIASILTDEIHESRDEIKDTITKEFEKFREDNIFAEDEINQIISMINIHKFDEANDKLNEMLEAQQFLSISQRELLYYQKARISIKKGIYQELADILKKIKRVNIDSIYILEINYYIACHEHDTELVEKIILDFEKYKYSPEKILLKKASFYVVLGKYSDAEELILMNGNLKENLIDYHQCYYIYGSLLFNKRKYKEAANEYKSAFEMHNDIIYRYNFIISSYFDIFTREENWIVPSRKVKEEAKYLHDNLKEIKYISSYFSTDSVIQYWICVINLALLIDCKLALNEILEIEDKYNNEIVKSLKADVYIKNGEDKLAKKILEEVWKLIPENSVKYFGILAREDNWKEILSKYEQYKSEIEINNPGIMLYTFEAKVKTMGLEKNCEELKKIINDFKSNFKLLIELIEIVLENNGYDFFNEIFNIVNENKNALLDLEMEELVRILFKYKKEQEIREIIEHRISDNKMLLKYYFMSFGELSKKSELLMTAKDKAYDLYNSGCIYKELLIFKINIDNIYGNPRNVLKTLDTYKNYYGVDEFFYFHFVNSKYESGEYDGIEEEMKFLLNTNNIFHHQLVARVKAKKGFWEEAQRIALKSLYVLTDKLGKEILINYINLFFWNIDKQSKESELHQVRPDTVVILKWEDKIRKIAIHKDSENIKIEGENKFDCENYSNNYMTSLILISNGVKDGSIQLDGLNYTITDIIDIHKYIFNYCLSKLQNEHPKHGYFTTISADTPEKLIVNTVAALKEIGKQRDELIDMYNFKNQCGLPISALSGQNVDNYFEEIIRLLNTENQYFYAGDAIICTRKKYVLSLSSIIILILCNLEGKLKLIEEKCCISIETEKSIIEGMRRAQELSNMETGRLLLNDSSEELLGYEENKEEKNYKRYFWTRALITISNIEKVKIAVDDIPIYDVASIYATYNDICSIEISCKKDRVLVNEDLFIKKIFLSINQNGESTNIVGLLVSENLLSQEELIEIILKLAKCNYLYSLSSEILLKVYLWIESIEDPIRKKIYFEKLREIFKCILSKNSIQYYSQIYKEFTDSIIENGLFSLELYELVREPFELKPLDELMREKTEEFFNNMFDGQI